MTVVLEDLRHGNKTFGSYDNTVWEVIKSLNLIPCELMF